MMPMTDSRPFLERVAADLLQKHADLLPQLTVVLPSRRACLYFKRYLAMVHKGPLLAPSIMAMDDFVRSKAQVERPSQVDLLLMLYRAFQEAQAPEVVDLERFTPLGLAMLSDFNLIDRNLTEAQTHQFFGYLEEIKAVERWANDLGKEIELPEESKAKDYLRFWKSLTVTYWKFRKALLDNGQAYAGMAYRLLLESLELLCEDGKIGQTVFVGFNMLTKAEQDLIKGLQREGLASSYWDMDRYYVSDPDQEAGLFFRTYRRTWLQDHAGFLMDNLSTLPKDITIHQSDSYTGQAQTAANVIHQIYQGFSATEKTRFHQDTNQIAILLPDEHLLSPLLLSMPDDLGLDWDKALNITMGLKIRQSQIHVLIEQLFKAQEGVVIKGEKTLVYFQHLVDILQHNFIISPQTQKAISTIRKQNMVYISHDEMAELDLTSDFIKTFFTPWDGRETKAIQGMLHVAEWLITASTNVPPLELEFISAWVKILRRLGDQFDGKDPVSVKNLRQFMTELLRQESVPFAGEPIAPIQIMGMLESRALDFEHVIILSCNEKTLPKENHIDSLIPFDLRTEYGLYTYREDDAVIAYTFYRLFHHAKTIHLVHAPASDQVGEESRFIKQIEEEYAQQDHVTITRRYATPPLPSSPEADTEIKQSDWTQQKIKAKLQEGISPSTFNRFLSHPKQFFLESVLKLYEADEVEAEMDARSFGDLVHEMLDSILQPHKGKQITQDQMAQMAKDTKLIHKAMLKAADEKIGKAVMDKGKNYILAEVAKDLVRRFFGQQVSEGDVHILDLETFYQATIPVKLDNGEIIPCRIAGKADRIDQIGDTIRVVDYKTGKSDQRELKAKNGISEVLSDGGKGKIVQLLLYKYLLIVALEEGTLDCTSDWKGCNIHAGFYFFRQINQGLQGYELNGEPEDHTQFKNYVEQLVVTMVKSMLEPNRVFGVNPAYTDLSMADPD